MRTRAAAQHGVASASGQLAGFLRPEPGPRSVALAFLVSGTVHLVAPRVFVSLVPRFLPRRREIVYLSGVAELICAGGLVTRARWAGPASAALLVAILPGNIQMAVDATGSAGPGRGGRAKTVAVWTRIPLQIPLILAALRSGRR